MFNLLPFRRMHAHPPVVPFPRSSPISSFPYPSGLAQLQFSVPQPCVLAAAELALYLSVRSRWRRNICIRMNHLPQVWGRGMEPPVGLGESTSQNPIWNDLSTKKRIQLLSVGRIEPASLVRETFVDMPDFDVSIAIDYRELWTCSKEGAIQIVLRHNSLCSFELEQAARLVRDRWPNAKILIIRSGELLIDRALYDGRLLPPVTPAVTA